MSYVSRVLQPGERVVFGTTVHWIIYRKAVCWLVISVGLVLGSDSISPDLFQAGMHELNALLERVVEKNSIFARLLPLTPKILVLIMAGVSASVALLYWLGAFMRRRATELAVTTRRVICKVGILRRTAFEIHLSKLESVYVSQSLWNRIFGFGLVTIKGTGTTEFTAVEISNPLDFRSHITAPRHLDPQDAYN
jgi:hypothetical protein